MDLERRIEQLEAKMKAMELELNELRRERPGMGDPRQQPANPGAQAQRPVQPQVPPQAPYASPQAPGAAYPNPPGAQPYQGHPGPQPMPGRPGVPGYPGGPGMGPYPGQPGTAGYPAQAGPHQGQPGQGPYYGQPRPAGPQAQRPPKPPKPPVDWEHAIAQVWLPRVFIVVLLLGVLWGFIAAVSAGYLTQPVRCLLGIVAAGAMYFFGERQVRAQREGLAQVLLGGSIAVLMLTFFAAHHLYELIPSWLAFLLYILSIALGVWTAVRRRSQTLVIIMTVGGYLIPFLVKSTEPNAWIAAGFELVFSLAMTALSIRYAYRAAYFVSIGVLHLPLMILYMAGDFEGSRHVFLGAVFLQHALLLVLSLVRPYRHRVDETVSLMTGFGLVVLWIYALYNQAGGPGPESMMMIIWAVIYSLIALWRVMSSRVPHEYMAIATCAWLVWLVEIVSREALPLSVLIEASLGLGLGILLRSRMQQITSAILYLFGGLSILQLIIHEILSIETLSWIALLASLAGLSAVLRRHMAEEWQRKVPDILMWSAALLSIVFLTEVTSVLTRNLSFDLQHLILSAEYALYAIIVIIYGVMVGKSMVRLAGLIVLLITLLKVIFFDLPGVSLAVRAILFIGLGVAGIAVSRILYKRKGADPEAPPGPPPGPPSLPPE